VSELIEKNYLGLRLAVSLIACVIVLGGIYFISPIYSKGRETSEVQSSLGVQDRVLFRVDSRVYAIVDTTRGEKVAEYQNVTDGRFICDGSRVVFWDNNSRDVTVVNSRTGEVIAITNIGNPAGANFNPQDWSCTPSITK